MLTRGFGSSKPKPAHIFHLSPPGQRPLCVRAHPKETPRLGTLHLHKIFKPQQTHWNANPLSPPKQPSFPLASGISHLHPHQLHFPRLLSWVIISIIITSKIRRPPRAQIWEVFPGTQPAASPVHQAGTDISKNSCSAPKWHWRHPQMPGRSAPRPLPSPPSAGPGQAIFCLIRYCSAFLISPSPSGLFLCLLL